MGRPVVWPRGDQPVGSRRRPSPFLASERYATSAGRADGPPATIWLSRIPLRACGPGRIRQRNGDAGPACEPALFSGHGSHRVQGCAESREVVVERGQKLAEHVGHHLGPILVRGDDPGQSRQTVSGPPLRPTGPGAGRAGCGRCRGHEPTTRAGRTRIRGTHARNLSPSDGLGLASASVVSRHSHCAARPQREILHPSTQSVFGKHATTDPR